MKKTGLHLADHGGYRTGLYYGEMQPWSGSRHTGHMYDAVPQPTVFLRRRLLDSCGSLMSTITSSSISISFYRFAARAQDTKARAYPRFHRIHRASKTSDWSKFPRGAVCLQQTGGGPAAEPRPLSISQRLLERSRSPRVISGGRPRDLLNGQYRLWRGSRPLLRLAIPRPSWPAGVEAPAPRASRSSAREHGYIHIYRSRSSAAVSLLLLLPDHASPSRPFRR